MGQNLARSYVQLATAEDVLRQAMAKVGASDLKQFRERTQVSQFRDTSIITVSFADESASRAAETANAIAAAFIDHSRALQNSLQGSTTQQLEGQVISIQADIRDLDVQIARLRADIASPPPSQSVSARSQQQVDMLQLDGLRQSKQQTLAQLIKTRDDMRIASARADSTVTLWQAATPPSDQESPRVGLNTLIGALCGGLVVLGVAGVVTYLDDRLFDPEAVRERLGLPTLGLVHLGGRSDVAVGKLFVRDAPASLEAEAFRSLRTNLFFANVDHPPRSLLITSARVGEGKSVVSANLALAFAESGTTTFLLDADLRRPSQHRLFRISPAPGLSSLLAATIDPADLERFRVTGKLFVVPSGALPPNPAELLSSGRMSALITRLTGAASGAIVIIDSSPVLAVTDPVALSTKCDGTLLVVDSRRTNLSAVRHAADSILHVHAHILGVVLNKITDEASSYYTAGYNSYSQVQKAADASVGNGR